MERDLVMGMRREAATAAVFLGATMEESSSSGCQSGWTLYLDHSDGQQRCVHHVESGHQRWMLPRATEDEYDDDDSMVSDASSGPPLPPRLLDYEDEEALLLRRGPRERSFGAVHRGGASASGSGSGSSGGTLSRSFHSQGRHEARPSWRRPVLVLGEEYSTLQYRDVDDNDDLDDTASSSAVPSCFMAAMHGVHCSSS